MRNDGAIGGELQGGQWQVAGLHIVLATLMRAFAMRDTAQDRHFVHLASQFRQMLPDEHSAHIRFHRLERTFDFGVGLRFGIESIDVARSARHPEHDDGDIFFRFAFAGFARPFRRIGFEGKELRQAQAQKTNRTHFEQIATGDAVTGMIHVGSKLTHLVVVHDWFSRQGVVRRQWYKMPL